MLNDGKRHKNYSLSETVDNSEEVLNFLERRE